ncbi:hypothetical protein D3C80_2111450 [compost metagenome]
MGDVIKIYTRRLGHCSFAGLDEQLGGFGCEDLIPDLGAGAEDLVGFGVKKLRIFGVRI